ncbi:MAG: hypothetical protein UY26_C0003G0196 [Candidatus Jorgensenbacteria bacterium GW2011_GWA1_48_13]|uniref:Uncharacterized protein n=1 Tax=Candidatus Jorgensenbacteria bacterium GW2011_GWB1_50_10 TaxID=1618665 RepID=A0A0G1W8N5_9BACT|nr:MAG: hypothetical protein UY26_C0003G0196 [Candidatus Jorgensenbacteria bacterium GW2011_GWA1_48_13]KKW15151.1 MAG: hypothetical protein UY55_C0002G0209 [Candidatus Jorgensenbacteria bacterium GW2011_GWB1_50_10]
MAWRGGEIYKKQVNFFLLLPAFQLDEDAKWPGATTQLEKVL